MTETKTGGEKGKDRPWYRKKRWWALGIAAVLVIAGIAGGESERRSAESTAASSTNKAANEKPARKHAEQDEPEMTPGQRNALESAEDYVEMMAFSKQGLFEQLSSPAGDGYSKADAKFAVEHLDVDWKEEAVEAAKNYLDMMPMSEQELFEQLTSAAGEKFTEEEARYAIKKAYR